MANQGILIVIVSIMVFLQNGVFGVKTAYYERCEDDKINKQHSCVQNQVCNVLSVSENEKRPDEDICHQELNDCPPTPEDLAVTVFEERKEVGGKMYFWANFTWSSPMQGIEKLRGFILNVSTNGRIYARRITVNISSDTMSQKVLFGLDCLGSPLPKYKRWSLTLEPIPHEPNKLQELMLEFHTNYPSVTKLETTTTTTVATTTTAAATTTIPTNTNVLNATLDDGFRMTSDIDMESTTSPTVATNVTTPQSTTTTGAIVTAVECPPGRDDSESHNSCVPCKQGFYKNSSLLGKRCQPCPYNYTTVTTGVSSIHQCIITCGAGYETNTKGDQCIACPLGKYKEVEGPERCVVCPNGSTRTTASVSRHACRDDAVLQPVEEKDDQLTLSLLGGILGGSVLVALLIGTGYCIYKHHRDNPQDSENGKPITLNSDLSSSIIEESKDRKDLLLIYAKESYVHMKAVQVLTSLLETKCNSNVTDIHNLGTSLREYVAKAVSHADWVVVVSSPFIGEYLLDKQTQAVKSVLTTALDEMKISLKVPRNAMNEKYIIVYFEADKSLDSVSRLSYWQPLLLPTHGPKLQGFLNDPNGGGLDKADHTENSISPMVGHDMQLPLFPLPTHDWSALDQVLTQKKNGINTMYETNLEKNDSVDSGISAGFNPPENMKPFQHYPEDVTHKPRSISWNNQNNGCSNHVSNHSHPHNMCFHGNCAVHCQLCRGIYVQSFPSHNPMQSCMPPVIPPASIHSSYESDLNDDNAETFSQMAFNLNSISDNMERGPFSAMVGRGFQRQYSLNVGRPACDEHGFVSNA